MKILIVDDENNIREGMAKYIRLHTDRFENVYTASNGDEALDEIIKYTPDVMLLDIQIPKKNGIEVMREAKKAGLLPTTIILSCHEDFTYAQQALHLGAKEYVLKPIRAAEILDTINRVVDETIGPMEKDEIPSLKMENVNTYVSDAVRIINDHFSESVTQEYIATKLGISQGYLSTLFKQNLGMGFIDYLNKIRVEKACSYLLQNNLKTYEVAYKVGYNDEKYFSRVFKKIKGMSPMEYKKKGDGI
ncbi:MAG: response regulator [Lachnospiraceae bacterium]|nr:response regulator [Lachnospiraceae bacterium]